jgi:hypothetical protein
VNKDNVISSFPPDPSDRDQFKLDTKGGDPQVRRDPLDDEWDNTYLDWKGKVLKVEWSNFYPEYTSPFYNTHYSVSVDSVDIYPLLPIWHFSRFVDKGCNARDKVSVKQVRMEMDSHFNEDQSDTDLRDSMCVTLFFQNVQGQLTGPIALGLARLRENYFGLRRAPTFKEKIVTSRKKKNLILAPPKYLRWVGCCDSKACFPPERRLLSVFFWRSTNPTQWTETVANVFLFGSQVRGKVRLHG